MVGTIRSYGLFFLSLIAARNSCGEESAALCSHHKKKVQRETNAPDMSQWAPRLRCNEARLARLFSSHPIKVVFTVGDWLGWGKRYFASLIPPEGKVYAVDQGACMEKTELSVYERFLSDALYSGYEHQMQQIRLRSVDAVDYLSSLVPDLIYLDACRDLYAELRLWYPLVQGRGVLCGNESQPVLYQFAQERGVRVEEDAHFWRIVE